MIKQLSDSQKTAIKQIYTWFARNDIQFITVGGYAGTGKTTLISIFRNFLNKKYPKLKVAFCSYTGKAANVLKNKLVETEGFFIQDYVGTIHSLIYQPLSENGQITGWKLKPELDYNLIIVDEASMIDSMIWSDLRSYNLPIIAVGDHGQLPPINENFNLLKEPQIALKEIHRQAQQNPIIQLSIQAREKGRIEPGDYGKNIKKFTPIGFESQELINELLETYNEETLILCGYNHTRVKLNSFVRSNLGFELQTPQTTDRVICLKNNHKLRIYNGMIGTIKEIYLEMEDWYKTEIHFDNDDGKYNGLVYAPQFNSTEKAKFDKKQAKVGDLFDFGYAMTVHKAQGSEANRVILFEERFSRMTDEDWKRWLYTAVTRAKQELFIIGN